MPCIIIHIAQVYSADKGTDMADSSFTSSSSETPGYPSSSCNSTSCHTTSPQNSVPTIETNSSLVSSSHNTGIVAQDSIQIQTAIPTVNEVQQIVAQSTEYLQKHSFSNPATYPLMNNYAHYQHTQHTLSNFMENRSPRRATAQMSCLDSVVNDTTVTSSTSAHYVSHSTASVTQSSNMLPMPHQSEGNMLRQHLHLPTENLNYDVHATPLSMPSYNTPLTDISRENQRSSQAVKQQINMLIQQNMQTQYMFMLSQYQQQGMPPPYLTHPNLTPPYLIPPYLTPPSLMPPSVTPPTPIRVTSTGSSFAQNYPTQPYAQSGMTHCNPNERHQPDSTYTNLSYCQPMQPISAMHIAQNRSMGSRDTESLKTKSNSKRSQQLRNRQSANPNTNESSPCSHQYDDRH